MGKLQGSSSLPFRQEMVEGLKIFRVILLRILLPNDSLLAQSHISCHFAERTVWLSFIDGNFGLVSPDEPEYDHNKPESDGENSRRCHLPAPGPDH